ncbi:ABC transporter permease [Ruegeria sp. EL01]|jgi:putative spermidine/putrescine transport system permease protein|uniref:ABC transporter permease n=1 Tax=Ruegeria sp. EL01 TaxID=2107578 RepID=UPI0013C4A2A3|nr:ABC transporter permease [Ruegeria sp. EL01]
MTLWRNSILSLAAIFLIAGFLAPIAIMFATSFYHRTTTHYVPGFELTHYLRAFDPLYLGAMWNTFRLSFLAATIAMIIAFPFTFFMAATSRKLQTVALVLVLSVLSLSEVIVAFSWSTALSRSAGISNLLVWFGLMDRPASWARGLPAVVAALTYFNLSFAILMLYPHCSRLDNSYGEAARVMGASPLRAFFNVIVPILRRPLVSTWIVLFVFSMGAVATPIWLGRPQEWMLAVHISQQALELGNMPFASALGVVFLSVAIILVAAVNKLGNKP